MKDNADIEISTHTAFYVFEPLTEKGSKWLVENVFGAEYGKSVVVKLENVVNLCQAAHEDGIRLKY